MKEYKMEAKIGNARGSRTLNGILWILSVLSGTMLGIAGSFAVAVSAIISAIIVGGKAALKNLSITKSTELVIMFSKVLSELLPEKRKKKRNENPRK